MQMLSSSASVATSAGQPTLTSGSSIGVRYREQAPGLKDDKLLSDAIKFGALNVDVTATGKKCFPPDDDDDLLDSIQRKQSCYRCNPCRENSQVQREVKVNLPGHRYGRQTRQDKLRTHCIDLDDSSVGLDSADHGDCESIYPGGLQGNVIGIRGFVSDELLRENTKQQANYNKLKYRYFALQVDYRELKTSLQRVLSSQRHLLKGKDSEINILRCLLNKNELKRTSERSESNNEKKKKSNEGEIVDIEALRAQIKRLELKLEAQRDESDAVTIRLTNENKRLTSDLDKSLTEIDNLKSQLRVLSLQPTQRAHLKVKNENTQLKEIIESNQDELACIRDRYNNLENQLSALLAEQSELHKSQNEEMARVFSELCRYEVYQPKLEMMLDNERKIKIELQNQVEQLSGAILRQHEEINKSKGELANEQARIDKEESIQVGILRLELEKSREKIRALTNERDDAIENVVNLRNKMDLHESQKLAEIAGSLELANKEMRQANQRIRELESKNEKLTINLGELDERLSTSRADLNTSDERLLDLTRKLELETYARENDRQKLDQFDQIQARFTECNEKLNLVTKKNDYLIKELGISNQQASRYRKHVNDLRNRIEMQQKLYDELKTSRNNELSKLKLDLNYERYNRQIALQGIENELKTSLRELETLKNRLRHRSHSNITQEDGLS